MPKSPAKVVPLTEVPHAPARSSGDDPAAVWGNLLAEARALPPGSDIEGFMERRLGDLARSARACVAQTRAEDQHCAASSPGTDSPPSKLP